jgi:hypothetical protein
MAAVVAMEVAAEEALVVVAAKEMAVIAVEEAVVVVVEARLTNSLRMSMEHKEGREQLEFREQSRRAVIEINAIN